MNKKRLLYISSEFFIDVDISLLKELENYFFVDWFLLLQKKSFYYDVNIIQNYSKNYNININILLNQNRYRSIKTFWFYCKVFWKAHKIKADIIYIETLGYPYLPLVSYFLIPLNKVVFGIHDYIFLLGEKNRNVKMFFSKVVFNIYKNFHFFSKSQEKHFLTSFPNKNTFNTPLSLKDFGQPENKFAFNLDAAKINVLFFGSIKEYKGLDILLEEFNMLEENVRNKLHITIWGQCEDFNIYKNLIKYPNNFTIKTTSVPNEVIPDLFIQHDLIVLPYRDVTQSGVLFIALNYSLPVICPNLEGFKEIVNSENAFIFYDLNIKGDLCRALTEVVGQGKSYLELLKRYMTENVRNKYKPSINAKIMAEKFQNIIQK